ncbi:MAG: hypothetical protein HOO94_07480 [Novosphingobium sp.]|nr:hypothetical protein [Novosphingobium sp.]
MGEQATDGESYGVLVGWSHGAIGTRLDLKLQCVQSTRRKERGDVDLHHVLMTREQATILANYLFHLTEQTPPPPRRRGLARWFGR